MIYSIFISYSVRQVLEVWSNSGYITLRDNSSQATTYIKRQLISSDNSNQVKTQIKSETPQLTLSDNSYQSRDSMANISAMDSHSIIRPSLKNLQRKYFRVKRKLCKIIQSNFLSVLQNL